MTGKVILLAAVVAVDPDSLRIDKGVLDGLRQGDLGSVHYRLRIGSESRRLEVGTARIVRLEDNGATLEPVADSGRPQPGYQVEFELPASRLEPAAGLLAMARHRADADRVAEAVAYLDAWEMLPAVGGAPEIAGPGDDHAALAADLLREVAEKLIENGDLERAERYLGRARDLRPGDSGVARAVHRLCFERSDEMAVIAAGEYRIGVDLEQARHFNQHPEFSVELAGFGLDREPVTRAEYGMFRPRFDLPETGDGLATGVSYGEAAAFCRWRGKRLPTELEWEIAVRRRAVVAVAPIYEWTASWYKPYPGNTVTEREYGETYRVLRGPLEPETRDPTLRRFLAPEARHSRVGFRCACDADVR